MNRSESRRESIVRNLGSRRRRLAVSAILGGAMLAVVSFQNFTAIPLEKLKLSGSYAEARIVGDGTDIRRSAPARVEPESTGLAVPTQGNDLGSVGRDWMTKQAKLITGGAEERALQDLNKKMNRWIQSIASDDSDDDTSEAGSRPNGPNGPNDASVNDTSSSNQLLIPTQIRFSRVNRFEMDWSRKLQLRCDYTPGGSVDVALTRPISEQLEVNIQHRSSDQSNSFRLNYRW